MDAAEYDRRFKQGSPVKAADDPLAAKSIDVDGNSVAPLHITFISRTPQERNQRMHDELAEHEEVVGYIGRVPLVRRRGGADYAGREQWEQLMRRCGRLRVVAD